MTVMDGRDRWMDVGIDEGMCGRLENGEAADGD